MKALPIVMAALGATVLLGSITPARADEDGWRRHEHHDREYRRGYYQQPGYYQQQPGYYVAPPVVVYAPPPVIYAPMPMIGIRIH